MEWNKTNLKRFFLRFVIWSLIKEDLSSFNTALFCISEQTNE